MREFASTASSVSSVSGEPRLNRRQAAKVRTRQKVLDAARDLFAERGYEPATIRDIAKGAGMSTGAVFANFQDKAELFEAVLTEDMAGLAETMKTGAGVARPEALVGWRRERLGAFCQRTGAALRGEALEREYYQILAELAEAEQSPRREG